MFSREDEAPLCALCFGKFELIKGDTCLKCDRPLEKLEPQFKVQDQCLDCVRWEKDPQWAGTLEKNYSVVTYNDFAKEIMAQYKYRGDYVLAQVIASLIKKKLSTIRFDSIVLIPLSDERQYERGFNQTEAIIRACGYTPAHLLARTHTEKQSKKSRSERIHLEQVFQIKNPVSNEKILLLDDIYTTGSTLRHAAKCLKAAGAQTVSSLTVIRG